MLSKPEDIKQPNRSSKDFLKEKAKVINIIEQPELAEKLEAIKASTENPTIKTMERQLEALRGTIYANSMIIQKKETDQNVIEYLGLKQEEREKTREADELETKLAQEKIKHGEENESKKYIFHAERNVVLNSPCKQRDYESKIKVKSKKDKLDLVCSETSGGAETYRYRHVDNPGDQNTKIIESKISEKMKDAMYSNKNLPLYSGKYPADVLEIARRIAIKAYEEGVSNEDPKTHQYHTPVTVTPEDRKWILNGDRHGGSRRGESYKGPISRMDGLLKRDLMKKTYADDGIARKFIHRSAQENKKISDSVHNAAYYGSIQGLDLQEAPAPEGDEEDDKPTPTYTKQQFVTDEMVKGWNPETKDYAVLTPEEEKQKYIESLEFKGLRELKQLAESLKVELIPDGIDELESDEEREGARNVLKELIIRKKYPEPEMEQGDEDDGFGGGGKTKKRRKSKKHKSKRRKSKRRKTRRRKR